MLAAQEQKELELLLLSEDPLLSIYTQTKAASDHSSGEAGQWSGTY